MKREKGKCVNTKIDFTHIIKLNNIYLNVQIFLKFIFWNICIERRDFALCDAFYAIATLCVKHCICQWYRCCFRYTPLHRYIHAKYPVWWTVVNKPPNLLLHPILLLIDLRFAIPTNPFNRFLISQRKCHFTYIHAWCRMNCQFAIHRRIAMIAAIKVYVGKGFKVQTEYLRALHVETTII